MMLEMILFVFLAILLLVVLRPKVDDRTLDLSIDEMLGAETAPTEADRDRPADQPQSPSFLGPDEATRRVYALRDGGEGLPVIAAILNAEGYRTAAGTEFLPIHVWQVLRQRKPYGQARRLESERRRRLQIA
jgi:hypothetical protein